MPITILSPQTPTHARGPIYLPASMRGYRPSGQITIEFFDNDRTITIDLVTCCHCRRDFKVSRGSGKRRGWCRRHNAPTCGRPGCDQCRSPSPSGRGPG